MKEYNTYNDKVKCPAGHISTVLRRKTTTGRTVRTYCVFCEKAYQIKAGPIPGAKHNG